MNSQAKIEKHPEVDKVVRALPLDLLDSFEHFEQQIICGGDLSEFFNTRPFSPGDGVGNRALVQHYHLRPCKPSCYLVGLVRSIDTVYVLDVFEHPPKGKFASSGIEELLYSRLSQMCPELTEYELPPICRSGLPVSKEDMYNPKLVKGRRSIAPVRALNSDYLPLGQIADLPDQQSNVAIVMGSFEVSGGDIPAEALDCLEYADHPARDNLTLYRAGWTCRSGIYRKETEQIVWAFCPLHYVAMQASGREKPQFFVLGEQTYRELVEPLKMMFPSINGKEQELGQLVGSLTSHYPLVRA